ncbi:M48 family metalloprotease [Laspinema olomoucense]|nr:M48 family metalloprotease [Laspinema sp. D3b]
MSKAELNPKIMAAGRGEIEAELEYGNPGDRKVVFRFQFRRHLKSRILPDPRQSMPEEGDGVHTEDRVAIASFIAKLRGIKSKIYNCITFMLGNQVKTAALLGLLSGLLVLGSYALMGNEQGLIFGLILAAASSLSSWYFSDRAALMAYRARPMERQEDPELYDMVARLSDRAEIPMPKLFTVPTQTPNAFATGRDPNNAAVAVTQGLRKLLTPEELEGVLAHELTHVKNRDTLTQAVAGTIGGAITFVGRILTFGALYGPVTRDNRQGVNPLGLLFLVVLAPLSAGLIQMAISRTREFAADIGSAEITENPLALASALEKLEAMGRQIPMNGNPAFSPLLIVNPLNAKGLQSLFRTHPPTEERIARLQEMAQQKQRTPVLA